jgi:FkbH-like protein
MASRERQRPEKAATETLLRSLTLPARLTVWKWDRMCRNGAEFDYFKLLSLGRGKTSAPAARVAVLGFCTTTYYTTVLRGVGVAAGFPLDTWESDYDAVEQTLLDDASPLYAFRPDVVVFATAVQALRDRFLAVDVNERPAVGEREAERLAMLIQRAARIPGVSVVVNNLVVPYERAWGNLSAWIEGSLPNVVRRINDRLLDAVRALENAYLVDCDHIASWVGKKTWFDERLWFYSKSFCHPDALPMVASQALDVVRAVKGKSLKCIALDLDNTLWGGVIGDDGLEGVRLGELGDGEAYVRFQRWLKELSRRGILLAVCSKNEEARAREPFQKHKDMVLREADIACFVANWDNKADNLRLLARRLNIGLDSFVFLDDSPFERNLVRELAPEVCVPEMPEDPAEFVPYLEGLNLFEALQFSDEDRQRTGFYRANVQREEEQTKFVNVDDYLASLKMTAEFERFDDDHLPRIVQMVQRTNQFNLTTLRHTAAELKIMAEGRDWFPFYVNLEDRFGDNGLVSVVVGKRDGDRLDVVTWLMSCRVIARRLEEFVLDRLVETASAAGLTTVRGHYLPTKKNEMVAKLYERLGFTPVDDGAAWDRSVVGYVPSGAPIKRKERG